MTDDADVDKEDNENAKIWWKLWTTVEYDVKMKMIWGWSLVYTGG